MYGGLDGIVGPGADDAAYGLNVYGRLVKRERGASKENSATAPATVSGERC